MGLGAELHQLIGAYVKGREPMSAVRDWLATHVQDIHDADDPEAEDLSGEAWTLFAEFDYGHRAEDGVRRELLAALESIQVARRGADETAPGHLSAPSPWRPR